MGELDQYYVENHHEAIISKEEYEAANAVVDRKRQEKEIELESKKYKNRYPLSGRVICGNCGGTYKRKTYSRNVVLACTTHIEDKEKCDMKYIDLSDVERAFATMINKLIFGRNKVLKPFYENLIIEPKEAETIKRIYREYLEGASLKDICESLMEDGILTGTGKKNWIPSTVHKILTNEKYIGDALLQKTVTTDFLEKKRQINNGLAPQYYVEGSYELIIPKHIFMRVQEELVRRANLRSGADGKKKRVYSSKYALSSICTCEKCGDVYRRIAWNNRGKKYTVWRCCTRV